MSRKKPVSPSKATHYSMRRKNGIIFWLIRRPSYFIYVTCMAAGERAADVRDVLHGPLYRAGGRNATKGNTDEWAHSGATRRVAVPIDPLNLRRLLVALDSFCHEGLVQIRVGGTRFA